jgi:tRNA(Ile)-lysidine synthase
MKSIEQKVIKFADQYKLISPGEHILIALSGGPDSVFALQFFSKFKNRFKISLGAAHVNHCLRGKNSDNDEKFCHKLCNELKIDFFSSKVDVADYAEKNKLSLEEAARELRYKSLFEIQKKYRFDKIITAHTIDDNAETVLLNLVKGTGLKGISGIPIIRGNIIRPLLVLSKEEILGYLDQAGIKFRNDESNKDIRFKRNFIRHKLIPLLKKEINPSLVNNIFSSSQVFRNTIEIVKSYVRMIINEAIQFEREAIIININSISKYHNAVLGEVLKLSFKKNFNRDFEYRDLIKIKSLIDNRVGKKALLSGNLIAFRDREKINIQIKRKDTDFCPIEVKIGEKKIFEGKSFRIVLSNLQNVKFNNDNLHEYISADGLDDKFIIRRWKDGDRFIPLGMKGSKNVSDFLTENKISAVRKKEQLVLENRNSIVWIIGLRIDDRFRITKNTKEVYELWMK